MFWTPAALCLLIAPAIAQSTWHVNATATPPGSGTPAAPYATIQYAIDQAATLSGDRLLIAAGLYLENVDLNGKALVLEGALGPRPVLHGGGMGSTLTIASNEGPGVELRHLEIIGGDGTVVGNEAYGGGVYMSQTSATLFDCLLRANEVCGSGGGVHTSAGNLTLIDCTFRDNVATRGGGVTMDGGTLTVVGSVFELNRGMFIAGCGAGNGRGGAINCPHGNLQISDSVFRGNAAQDGGAINYDDSNVGDSIDDCVFEDNGVWAGTTVATRGGALSAQEALEVRNSVFRANHSREQGGACYQATMIDCLFENNTARSGGGIYDGSALNCIFRSNHAIDPTGNTSQGGATFSASLSRCVVWGNTAEGGAGGCDNAGPIEFCTVIGNMGHPSYAGIRGSSIKNSICWGNRSLTPGIPTTQLSATQLQYSIVEFLTTGASTNINAQPLLWGILTGDAHLLPGSPAIDAGDPNAPLDPDGSPADIGAFPYDPTWRGEPGRYCIAKTTSAGCVPAIVLFGTPSLTGPPASVLIDGVPAGQNGILLLSRLPQAIPFFGGKLCIAAPIVRTGIGTAFPSSACGDSLIIPFGASIVAQTGVASGDLLFAQMWFRDPQHPDGTGVGLSDGLVMVIQP